MPSGEWPDPFAPHEWDTNWYDFLCLVMSEVTLWAWEPDIGRIWFPPCDECAETALEIDQQPEKIRLHKPGKPEAYNWKLVVAAEMLRRAKKGEKDPTAVQMIQHCAQALKGGYEPGSKEMQIFVKQLRSGQF